MNGFQILPLNIGTLQNLIVSALCLVKQKIVAYITDIPLLGVVFSTARTRNFRLRNDCNDMLEDDRCHNWVDNMRDDRLALSLIDRWLWDNWNIWLGDDGDDWLWDRKLVEMRFSFIDAPLRSATFVEVVPSC